MRCGRLEGTGVLAVVLLALVSVAPRSVAAQTGEIEVVVAGEEYGSPPGGKFLFGDDYRDLWTRPIPLPVLDLDGFAGGLTPVKRIGGMQSKGLALEGADGRDYSFRSLNKDMSRVVPEEFQDSILEHIVQDQIAGNFPGVQVVVPPLAGSAGVLAVDTARLVVLPDDPRLGEFRSDFAGVPGVLLEYPQPRSATNPGFHGATEILGHREFWERRHAAPDALPDTRAFLRARLLDILLNDWDRHRQQWRWARIPGEPLLQPIPEDRDQVFTDYEGLGLNIARFMGAPYVTFEEKYPSLPSIIKNGWDVDRFLLTDIEKPEWMEIAAAVQAGLTDEVIDSALLRLPEEYYELRGKDVASILKARRDGLVEEAERYYHYMAGQVDVQCTDVSESVLVEWLDGGDVEVSVARLEQDGTSAAPWYRRRFKRDETDEVRVYLQGGNDELRTLGDRRGGVKVRAIGGPGNDSVDDAAGSGISFYDSQGDNRVEGGNGTGLDSRPFVMPPRPMPNDVTRVPNPDWGHITSPIIALGYSADPGFLVGGGFDRKNRGFRKYPWSNRHIFKAAWAFGVMKPYVDYVGSFRRQNSNIHFGLRARVSGIEQLRYYGLGNETTRELPTKTYEVSNYQASLFPALVFGKGAEAFLAVGPFVQYSDTTTSEPESIIEQEQPLGSDKYGMAGLKAKLLYDSRPPTNLFAGGIDLEAKGQYFFEGWDVESAFGSFEGELNAHIPMGKRLLLNLGVGGKKVWGDYPYFEAAYIGARTTMGYGWNRWAGDASLYGSSELRIVLAKLDTVVPGELGVAVMADAGRVFLEGEDSSNWHPSVGAGIFYAPFGRKAFYEVGFGKNDDAWFFLVKFDMSGIGFK